MRLSKKRLALAGLIAGMAVMALSATVAAGSPKVG